MNNQNLISPFEGISTLLCFGILCIGLVLRFSDSRKQTEKSFLIANHQLHWLQGALCIAVSWIWAPAIFICSLQSYTKGLAGAFWFIAPNVLCFFIFAPIAVKIRKEFPMGHTFPEYIAHRYPNSTSTHLVYLTILLGYQLSAIVINCTAGGILLNALAGIDFPVAVIALSSIAITYTLLSGLEASVLTDVAQMLLILVTTFILVPWVLYNSDGLNSVYGGLAGVTGEFGDIFNPKIAFTFGISMTLSLISGPFADQQFFQRVFAVRQSDVSKTFIFGGLFFAIVPILLCLFGFIAANPQYQGLIKVTDPQMVGPIVIAHFLPKWTLLLFLFMAFAGLCSTIDSAYCAVSALGSIDIYKRYVNPNADSKDILCVSRRFMLGLGIIGTLISLFKLKLLWMFLIYGAFASAGFFPTVLSIYWKDLSPRIVFYAILLSLLIGTPISIYANITENENLIVLASILSAGIGLVICLFGKFSIFTSRSNYSKVLMKN